MSTEEFNALKDTQRVKVINEKDYIILFTDTRGTILYEDEDISGFEEGLFQKLGRKELIHLVPGLLKTVKERLETRMKGFNDFYFIVGSFEEEIDKLITLENIEKKTQLSDDVVMVYNTTGNIGFYDKNGKRLKVISA
jgi:hypothetical protein|nr:MAG TPA: hypothetical protein [Caudoviricetes sp.]